MVRFFLLFLFLTSTHALSEGLSPYLPLKISPEIESQIEKVMALTPGAPLSRPYKASDLSARLNLIKDDYPTLYQGLSSYLERLMQPMGITHFSASFAASNDNKRALPNQRNMRSDSGYQVSLGGQAYMSPYAYVSAGMQYSDDEGLTHYNSHLAFGYEYLQVELGYREHWFSPFQDSAMLVSTHAKASPSITISNSTPITSWNIRYEVFYSELEEVDEIVLGDEAFPGKPRHAGVHLSFTPLDFWTVGLNRTLQFGGGKRKVSFSDVLEALFDPSGKDNVGDVDTDDPNFEFGNQQASLTSKWNFHWYTPVSFYVEYAGEDTVDESNFKLGNQALSFGLYLPALTDDVAVRYEFSDWADRWYVHHLYPDGYTNEGQIIGHWGAGERVFGEDTFAKVHALNVNWRLAGDQLIDFNFRAIQNRDTPQTKYETGYEAQVSYSFANQYGFWGLELFAGKDVFGENFSRLSGFYRW